MPTELHGTVVNGQDAPLQGAIVTLITEVPQVKATDPQGQFHFSDLTPGAYKVSVVMKGHPTHLRSDIVVKTDEISTITITMDCSSSKPNLNLQSVALSAIAIIFAVLLFTGMRGSNSWTNDAARASITYLVSVGTIMIAMVLVLSVILGDSAEMEARFARGKEVLTILIGVLGTIMGFYYGSAVKAEPPAAIQMATVKITPDQPQAGSSVNFSALVAGGVPPYIYSISFAKDVSGNEIIPPVVNQPSSDGKINQNISIPANVAAGTIGFQIVVKDKEGATYTYNEKGEQKITLLARAPAPSPTPAK